MLSLESFKLLNAKANSFDRGTGGTPETTFQEVCDALALVSTGAAIYARRKYAGQESWNNRLEFEVKKVVQQTLKLEVMSNYWRSLVQMAMWMHMTDKDLTPFRKARRIQRRWWKRGNEDDLRVVLGILDDYDFELRSALKEWNEQLLGT